MGFFDKLQSKYELYKLEQRYTKRKRRTTFISDATYVDGEYVYYSGETSPTHKSSFSSRATEPSNTGNSRRMSTLR